MFSMDRNEPHTKRYVYYRQVDELLLNVPFSWRKPLGRGPCFLASALVSALALPSLSLLLECYGGRRRPRFARRPRPADVRSVREAVDEGLGLDDWLGAERSDDGRGNTLADSVDAGEPLEARSHDRSGATKRVEQGLGARRADIR